MAIRPDSQDELQKMIEKYKQEMFRYQQAGKKVGAIKAVSSLPPEEGVLTKADEGKDTAAFVSTDRQDDFQETGTGVLAPKKESMQPGDKGNQAAQERLEPGNKRGYPDVRSPFPWEIVPETPDTSDETGGFEDVWKGTAAATQEEYSAAVREAEKRNAETLGQDAKGEGKMRIFATTGRGAFPVEGAHVTISRDEGGEQVLYQLAVTDESGSSPVCTLPTLRAELSQQPGTPLPYLSYHIRVEKPGYFIFDARNVPVYDGVSATQTVDMVPVPEGYVGDRMEKIVERGPANLYE